MNPKWLTEGERVLNPPKILRILLCVSYLVDSACLVGGTAALLTTPRTISGYRAGDHTSPAHFLCRLVAARRSPCCQVDLKHSIFGGGEQITARRLDSRHSAAHALILTFPARSERPCSAALVQTYISWWASLWWRLYLFACKSRLKICVSMKHGRWILYGIPLLYH